MKKRVFLDEHLGDSLRDVFGAKAHVYTARALGASGKDDQRVIDRAVEKKCLIVTNDEGFVARYRNLPGRKRGEFYYGLIHLCAQGEFTRKRHLEAALREMAWAETRRHDDLITVFADGRTKHERLCHPGCAAEYEESEGT